MAGSKDRLDLAKRNSRAQVLLAIHKHGAISRVQLAKMTGQSTTNIGRIVDELLSEDVLVETGAVYGPRGRPMVLLTINPEGAPIGGIWFGPENIEIAIASPAGEILGYRAVSYDSGEKKPFAVIVAITQAIQKAVEALGKDFPRLHGVGVTVPGVVDPEEGTIISMPHRPEWDNVPIARLLRARLGVSVSVANDVSAAAAAAEWRNGKSQSGGELYVIVSSGISSVLVSDNGVLRGAHDAAGAIGHMIVDSQGPLCITEKSTGGSIDTRAISLLSS